MNVLITSAGRRDYLVEYFRTALDGSGIVVAADTSPDASALATADVGTVVPPLGHPDYLATLFAIVRTQRIGLLLTVNDDDALVLCHHADAFRDLGCMPMLPSPAVVNLAMDKLQFGSYCRVMGIAHPTTYTTIEDALQAVARGRGRFPMVVKPRFGSGSRCTHIVHDEAELHAAFRLAHSELRRLVPAESTDAHRHVLVQQFVEGAEYGLDVVNGPEGWYVATLARRKLAMRHGETDKAITVEDEQLTRLGEQLSSGLRHVGCLDCDVIRQGDTCVVLDVNPRIGGGYPFMHEAGADLPRAYLAWARGGTPDHAACFQPRPGVAGAKSDRVRIRRSAGADVAMA